MPIQAWFGPSEAEVLSLCIPNVACMPVLSGSRVHRFKIPGGSGSLCCFSMSSQWGYADLT